MSENAMSTVIPRIPIPDQSKTIMYIVILIAVIVIFYLIWKYLTGNIKLVLAT